MLNEASQDMKQFEFLDVVNPNVFSTWNGVAPREKFNLLERNVWAPLCLFMMSPGLQSQFIFIYHDKRTTTKSLVTKY